MSPSAPDQPVARGALHSLRVRLVLLLVLAIIPAQLVVAQWVQGAVSQLVRERLQEQAQRLVQLASLDHQRATEGTRQLLVALSQIPELRDGDSASCNRLLRDLLAHYEGYTNLGVTTVSGDLYCSALPFTPPVNVADRSWFQSVLATRGLASGDYQVGRVSGQQNQVLGYPALDAAGQIQAVVFAGRDLSWLNQLIAASAPPAGATLAITDRDGLIVARYPDPERWVGQRLPDAPLLQQIRAQGEGTAELMGLDGVSRVYAFAPLHAVGDTGTISAGLSPETLLGTVDRVLARALAALAVAALLAVVAAWLGCDLFVVRPLNKLVAVAERLRAGDLRARAGGGRARDELGRLASAFDAMATAVEEHATELSAANAALQAEVAERKTVENQLQALTRAERLRALGQMASGVAHDLNQNLALVAGHGELALRMLDQPGGDPLHVRREIDLIVKAALDGAETVKRLQTFARPQESGPLEPVESDDLLRDVALLTAPRWRDAAQRQGRVIRLQVEVESGLTIAGEPESLREALTSLIFNAVDALPHGGLISLSARRRGDEVVVQVTDSGIGMSPDVQARIFEPFFTTKGAHGTGLGLSVVFGIVERHRGRVEVDSAPGQGTTFTLVFPAATGSVVGVHAAATAADVQPRRVLVVDDHAELADLLVAMLAADGHTARTAMSAEEALVQLAREPVDLLISDVGMGEGMNGWELIAEVRARYPGLPVVLATGWAAEIDAAAARRQGVLAILPKPYSRADLEGIFRTLDARHPAA